METWLLGGVFAPLIPMNIHHGWFRWRRLDLQIWNPEVATSSGGCHINPPWHDFNSISAPEKIGHHSTPNLRKRVDCLPMLDSRSVFVDPLRFRKFILKQRTCSLTASSWSYISNCSTHQRTNISPKKWHFEHDFPNFPRWDMLRNFLEGRSIISI